MALHGWQSKWRANGEVGRRRNYVWRALLYLDNCAAPQPTQQTSCGVLQGWSVPGATVGHTTLFTKSKLGTEGKDEYRGNALGRVVEWSAETADAKSGGWSGIKYIGEKRRHERERADGTTQEEGEEETQEKEEKHGIVPALSSHGFLSWWRNIFHPAPCIVLQTPPALDSRKTFSGKLNGK
jgi:hypothetical protein